MDRRYYIDGLRRKGVFVLCKNCKAKIQVSGRPHGAVGLSGVRVKGKVSIEGSRISFGPGGGISFGSGGGIRFGSPQNSEFVCMECGHMDTYRPEDFVEENT